MMQYETNPPEVSSGQIRKAYVSLQNNHHAVTVDKKFSCYRLKNNKITCLLKPITLSSLVRFFTMRAIICWPGFNFITAEKLI